MEEILHHLLSMKPYENWDILHMNWCRIKSHHSRLWNSATQTTSEVVEGLRAEKKEILIQQQ